MANELVINYPTGSTLYALLFDATGQVWNGAAFEAPGSANWPTYDIAMTEVATATGIYRGTMPAAVAGHYSFTVRKQAGAGPAVADIAVGSGVLTWNGTVEVSVVSFAAAAITAAAIATDAITSDELAATATAEIAAAAWAYATRTLTSTAAATTAAVSGSTLTVTRGVSYAGTLSGLTIPATWSKMLLTAKGSTIEADANAQLQIVESNPGVGTDGLLYIAGGTATASSLVAADASLTVDQAAGTIAIVIDDEATVIMVAGNYSYDVKCLLADGTSQQLSAPATLTVSDGVTAAIT